LGKDNSEKKRHGFHGFHGSESVESVKSVAFLAFRFFRGPIWDGTQSFIKNGFEFKLGLRTGGFGHWKIQNAWNGRAKFRPLLKPNVITPGMNISGTAAGD
jgi:hypothetical protein